MLSALVNPQAGQDSKLFAPMAGKFQALQQALDLESEDILILRLVYIEGMKQTLVAQSMQLKPYQLNRQLKQILDRIREALVTVGISVEEVRGVLTG